MWLAQSMKQAVPTADADQGISTIVGDQMGVVTGAKCGSYPSTVRAVMCGCRRAGLPCWSLRAAPAERSSVSAAVSRRRPQRGCSPGEVYIYGPKGSNVYLQKDGTIELTGRISIRGQFLVNGEPYKPCTCGGGL